VHAPAVDEDDDDDDDDQVIAEAGQGWRSTDCPLLLVWTRLQHTHSSLASIHLAVMFYVSRLKSTRAREQQH
jgi:hypothetical protein